LCREPRGIRVYCIAQQKLIAHGEQFNGTGQTNNLHWQSKGRKTAIAQHLLSKRLALLSTGDELNLASSKATISNTRSGGVCAVLPVTHGLESSFSLPSIAERLR
jgi:hypothetical protein